VYAWGGCDRLQRALTLHSPCQTQLMCGRGGHADGGVRIEVSGTLSNASRRQVFPKGSFFPLEPHTWLRVCVCVCCTFQDPIPHTQAQRTIPGYTQATHLTCAHLCVLSCIKRPLRADTARAESGLQAHLISRPVLLTQPCLGSCLSRSSTSWRSSCPSTSASGRPSAPASPAFGSPEK